MKRLLSLLLVVMLILTACGGNTSTTAPSEVDETGKKMKEYKYMIQKLQLWIT